MGKPIVFLRSRVCIRGILFTLAVLFSTLPTATGTEILCDDFESLARASGCSAGTNTDNGVNAPLTGRMLLNRQYLLDVPSGRTRLILDAVDSSLNATPYGWPVSRDTAVPSRDGTRVFAVAEECEDSLRQVRDCVLVRDFDGTVLSRSAAEANIMSGVHESPDSTLLAMVVYNAEFATKVLRITDLEGKVLSEGFYEDGESIRGNVDDVRWLPDGDLVYLRSSLPLVDDVEVNLLVRVSGASLGRPEDDRVIFDGALVEMPGVPGVRSGLSSSFGVNPISGEIAFVWDAAGGLDDGVRGRDETLYRIGANGEGRRAFARAATVPWLERPVWSPDGQWLAVTAGGTVGGEDGNLQATTVLAALRTNAPTMLVIKDRERTETESIRMIRSDCWRGPGGCGRFDEELPVVSNKLVTGWFR